MTRGDGQRAHTSLSSSLGRQQTLRTWYPPPFHRFYVGTASLKRAELSPAPLTHTQVQAQRAGGGRWGALTRPFRTAQAGLPLGALTPGGPQAGAGGGMLCTAAPTLPSFRDTCCRLQVLGACSADADRTWAALSVRFLLTSVLKSVKLKMKQ